MTNQHVKRGSDTQSPQASASASEYTIRKMGDNYGLLFRGEQVGLFANRQTASKFKAFGEYDRRLRKLGKVTA